MAVIVDASAVAAMMFGEPEGPTLAAHLEDETLLAPTLLDYELVAVALKKVRRQPETTPFVLAALDAAIRLPITRVAVPGAEVFELARRSGLSAYDASYLWLAESRDLELVTLDRGLARWRQD
jgi:predicted nucleic acid-binding protein